MSLLDYLFPVRLKDFQKITAHYEKAVDDHAASFSLSILFKDDKQHEVQRSFTKSKEEEDNR